MYTKITLYAQNKMYVICIYTVQNNTFITYTMQNMYSIYTYMYILCMYVLMLTLYEILQSNFGDTFHLHGDSSLEVIIIRK